MSDTCPSCGSEFNSVALHWSTGECEHPKFTDEHKQIIVGLLMGDGNIDNYHEDKNPRLRTNMISPNYLEYLDNKFGVIGNGVKFNKSAERNAELAGSSEHSESYSDSYRWSTTRHPDLQEYADWYSSGFKVWPDDIQMTPITLKHLYCGDGYYNYRQGYGHIEIAMDNEFDNKSKVSDMFANVGLPEPKWNSGYARWTKGDSETLWEYMGEPLPDFEYKWPEEYK